MGRQLFWGKCIPKRPPQTHNAKSTTAEHYRHNMMDPSVTELLGKHKGYFEAQDNGRLVCTLNKHSLPPSRQALETFVK
ncbi:hypothetical protein ABBQ32_004379 [Trebouxia sp. C0010 RCD-2024]